ncbi:MAG TPA: Ig-like domain-containing protein, partial [Thermoanaerobaculaceae bacterium]|nr:Ig-like domain-containing protein [Thermoanaerobaculaceae bacterium]
STVRGIVVDVDGVTPVPGASVSLATATLLPQAQQTDALGRFEYSLVPPGNVVVAATGTVGAVERVGQVISGSMQPGQTFDVTVRLKEQGTVRGQVVERVNGELVPVPGAHFRLNESDYPQRRLPAGQEWSFADAEGRFSVSHVFAGRVSATVQHPETLVYGGAKGVLSTDWEVVDLGQIELQHDVGSIIVTVRDPVTGAVVPDCQVSTGDDRGTTDSDGRARFDVLSLFLHQFYAFHAPTGRSGRLNDVRLSTPGQIVEGTLYLEARGEVTGHLYEDQGKTSRVAGASVLMSGGGVGGALSVMATTSGETATVGQFGFSGIPAGHFDLLAWTQSSQRKARGSVDLSTTAPLVNVDLFLERIGELDVRIFEKLQAGLVELNPGQRVLSVEVVQDCIAQGCVYAFTQLEPGLPWPGHLFQFADVLGDRPVHVSVKEFDGEQRSGYVYLDRVGDGQGTSANPIAVVLGPRAVVQVMVRDAVGNPLQGVPVVVALGGAGWSTTVISGADGTATALGVPAGNVFASATLQGQGGSARGLLEFDDQVLQLAISLSPSVAAHGVVYQPVSGDAVGTGTTLVPQSRAIASLTDTNGVVHVSLTGEDGVYRFSGLPVGGYSLRICDYTCEAEISISGLLAGPHGTDIALDAVVLDAVPPEVVSIVPPPATEGVSRMATVEVTFSEPLHESVLPTPQGGSTYFSVVSSSGQPAVGTWTATVSPVDGRQVVRFVPSEAFENLTWYSLLIKGTDAGVKDRAGRRLSSSDHVGSSFKTSDTIGPSIVATDPSLLRPVPQAGALRVDFSEVVKASDGMLDGVGGDDAAALTWEKRSPSGEVTLEPFPLTLQLTRGDSSLLIHRAEGISLEGDTGWRELTIRRITDLHDNPMVSRTFRFRTRDTNPPELTLNPPANAPGGDLAAGTTYLLLPQFLSQSLDDPFPPQADDGDVEKVEYFLTEPLVGSFAPPTFTATGVPFGFSFVAPSGGSGTELKVWARATDSSTNQGGLALVVMHVVPNQTPVAGSVTARATSPVAGTTYAGSRVQVTSTGLGDSDGALLSVKLALV